MSVELWGQRLCSRTNPRFLSLLVLSFASGLPLILVGSTLQAWYTVSGVSLLTIGALTLIGQPYVYKFLWAPFIDRFTWSGARRRGWMGLTQLLIAMGLGIMAFLRPDLNPGLLAWVALGIAFFSATQDIAVDAYRVEVLRPSERGPGVAINTLGYRLALLVGGALALIFAAHYGWRLAYLSMAALMLLSSLVTALAPEPLYREGEEAPKTLMRAVGSPLLQLLKRNNAVALLLFILLYKLPDAFAFALNTAFLIKGVGFSLEEIGFIYKTVALVATILGSLLGGWWMPKLGVFRSLFVFGCLQAGANLAYMTLAMVGKGYFIAIGSIFFEYFCSGLSTVAFVVFLMGLCDRRYTATHYAIFSAVAAMGRVFAGPGAAILVTHWGWAPFYFFTCLLGGPGLLLLWWLRRRVDFNVPAPAL